MSKENSNTQKPTLKEQSNMLIKKVNNIVSETVGDTESYRALDPEWQLAARRWVQGKALIQTLSNLLDLPKSTITANLKNATKNRDADFIFEQGVREGLELGGKDFESALITELKRCLKVD